ncbi:signal peptidase I [candidate division KSB1 bacterium]|nr:signal peptidase I [candidate division KSB1 bacterium]RQW05667.1 MAG: signal peptidase I [candidate division KSB1 bacterium]
MSKKKSKAREFIESIGVALIAALIIRALVIQSYRIPTGSMKDTLLIGDFLLVNKFIYGINTPNKFFLKSLRIPSTRLPGFKEPKRGDIVVFRFPNDVTVDYIKRCVALAGDTIVIRDSQLYINGQPEGMEEFLETRWDREENRNLSYFRITKKDGQHYIIRKAADPRQQMSNWGAYVVPPNHIFMMGDNRDNSYDSRMWKALPNEYIVGQALVIFFSWDKMEPLFNLHRKIRWERIFSVIR